MKKVWFITFFLLSAATLYSDEFLSISVAPSALIPLGPEYSAGVPLYSLGGGGDLGVEFPLPFADFVFLNLNGGYSLYPLFGTEELFHILSIGGGAGLEFVISPLLNLRVRAGGGYYRGLLSAGSDGSFFADGSASLNFEISRGFEVFLSGGYRYHFYQDSNIVNGIHAGIGSRFNLIPEDRNIYLKAGSLRIFPVFPVFYSYYNSNPLGTLLLVNEEEGGIEELEVSVYNEQFMDNPRVCVSGKSVQKSDEIEVLLYALFNDSVLEITEGTVVSCKLLIKYSFEGKQKQYILSEPMTINNRNAMTWDDDRKAASFVTARNPEILKFARNTAGTERDYKSHAVSRNFRIGVAIAEAVAAYGVTYIIDPSTPFIETSKDESSVDYLQFPHQTLSYRAGDCDDLAILFTSLLEAAGVETAFVTVPGHIFAAFNPGISAAEAGRIFPAGQYIEYDGRVWLPIEITVLDKGFQQAWQKGTSQWNEHSMNGQAVLLPLRDAWQIYPPVAVRSASDEISISFLNGFSERYGRSLERVISRIIAPEEDRLKTRLEQKPDDKKLLNRLGVLYARFGRYDDAGEIFEKVERQQYPPVYANLANLAFAEGDYDRAREYYQRALSGSPGKYRIMLNLSQLEYDVGNFREADRLYSIISLEKPELTDGFEFLSLDSADSGRAESGSDGSALLWIEEDVDE